MLKRQVDLLPMPAWQRQTPAPKLPTLFANQSLIFTIHFIHLHLWTGLFKNLSQKSLEYTKPPCVGGLEVAA